MSTSHPDLFTALAAPFEQGELKNRSQGGRTLHYITARTVMNRLDAVLGPENWWDEFSSISDNSILCKLTIRLPDGSTLTKADAGGCAGMADSGDDDKSSYSDALKRAAVKFGVARYLYGDGVPSFVMARAPESEEATRPFPGPRPRPVPTPPPTPAPTPPATNQVKGQWGNGKGPPATNGKHPQDPKVPTTGKQLFAWTKEQEQRYSVGLLKYLNSWAKLQDFPGRIVDWGGEQVKLAHAEACRKLRAIESTSSDAYEDALAN